MAFTLLDTLESSITFLIKTLLPEPEGPWIKALTEFFRHMESSFNSFSRWRTLSGMYKGNNAFGSSKIDFMRRNGQEKGK